jgi:uncharacterized sulfatase
MGANAEAARPAVFGFRGRMDERIDMVRSVRNQRYVFIRNLMPHRIYGQHVNYMFEMPTAQKWKQLYDEGKLNPAQSHFWKVKPTEELYDLDTDPDEVNNLAAKPEFRKVRDELSASLTDLALRIRDVGFLPENEIHARAGSDAPYSMAQDRSRYNASATIDAAIRPYNDSKLTAKDSAIRYWGLQQLLFAGKSLQSPILDQVRKLLADDCPNVRISAAELLSRYGASTDLKPAIELLLIESNAEKSNNYIAVAALNALTEVGAAKLKPYRASIEALPKDGTQGVKRAQGYVPRLIERLLELV